MGGGERDTNGDEKESVEGSWEKKKERERARTHRHGQQCGDVVGAWRWVKVKEGIGE